VMGSARTEVSSKRGCVAKAGCAYPKNASVFGDVQGYVRGDNLGHDVFRVGKDYRSSPIPTHPRPAWLRPHCRDSVGTLTTSRDV
jgi:hypothetical protein